MTATMTVQEATVTTAISTEIVRSEPYTHVVPGTYTPAGSETFQIVELRIGHEIVGVEIHGETYDPCKRCVVGGHYSFNGHDSICYGCHGYSHGKATTEADIVRRYVARQKAAAKKAAEAERAAREQAEALATWAAENADVAAALVAHRSPVDPEGYADFSFRPRDKFLTSLADQATYKALSPKQTAAAEAALARLVEKDAERDARNADKVAAGHWGEVGKRAEVEVTVRSLRAFDGDYGTRWLCTMETAEGQTIKTWTSGAFVDVAIEREKDGQPVRIKATVKDHGTYRDLPETTVSRVTAL